MHYVGAAIVNGVSYAIFSDLDMPFKKIWADHVIQVGDTLLCDGAVRIVEIGTYRVPDDYNEVSEPPHDEEYE